MTTEVQNLNNGRKWDANDLNLALGEIVGQMVQGSFHLIAVASLQLTIGVYVDNLSKDDVKAQITDAMASLNYGRTSRYMLTSAALDISRDLVKRLGRPDGVEHNVFWDMVQEVPLAEAVAMLVSALKSNYGVNPVQELNNVLKPKVDKPKVDKPKASEPTPEQPTAEKDKAPLLTPVQAIMATAQGLSDDELADLMTQLAGLVEARAQAQQAA